MFEPFMNLLLIIMAVAVIWIMGDVLIECVVLGRWGDSVAFSIALAMLTIAMHELYREADGIMIVAAIALCTWKASSLHNKGIV